MVKPFLILFLILAILAVGGGSFYYFEIYQPRTYVTLLLSLYQKLEQRGLQPNTSSLKDAADYESALKVLEERIHLLQALQDELTRIQAPKRMADIKKEFADYLVFTQTQHVHAMQLASFLRQANELQDAIKQTYGGLASEQHKVTTMGDLQTFWGEHIPRMRTIAEKFFSKEITASTSPSFAELKSLWGNASPAFDLVLKKVKTVNPDLPIGQAGNLFTPVENKQLEKYSKYLEEFTKKLEVLIKHYSAYDLLTFRDFPSTSSPQASERSLEFYQTIQQLKEQYAQ